MTEAPLILLTDDSPDVRSILSLKLEASGFRVVLAENGRDAIDKCKRRKPDLIIMDVSMPVMSGTEAVSKIKEDPELKDVKIVFLSNHGEEQEANSWLDKKYAHEMGVLDYIRKTDDLELIVARIKSLLNE